MFILVSYSTTLRFKYCWYYLIVMKQFLTLLYVDSHWLLSAFFLYIVEIFSFLSLNNSPTMFSFKFIYLFWNLRVTFHLFFLRLVQCSHCEWQSSIPNHLFFMFFGCSIFGFAAFCMTYVMFSYVKYLVFVPQDPYWVFLHTYF